MIFPSPRAVSSAMEDALSQAGIKPDGVDIVVLGSPDCRRSSELESVRSLLGAREDGPILISSDHIFGEVFAAGPIVNAILGIKIFESASIPKCLSVCGSGQEGQPDSVRFQRIGSNRGRILINSMSYEGQCASMIIEAL
jgi:3-oxoacyl-(acyl-carrier-protein) synthase